MIGLALRGIRYRLAGFLAILISAALGAALLVVSGAFFETGIRLTAETERLAGAPLVVVGTADYALLDSSGERSTDLRPFPERHRLEDGAVATIGAIDGVREAVAVRFFDGVITAAGPSQAVTIQDDASARFGLLAGEGAPRVAEGEVVLTPTLAERLGVGAGDTARLMLGGVESTVTVSALAGAPDDPDTAIVNARSLPPTGTVDAVAVALDDPADASKVSDGIRTEVRDVTVLEGPGRGSAEYPAVAASRTPTIVTGAVFAGIVIVVLATVTSATVTLSVRQRAREISLLRATGATGRQAKRMVVAEVMIVGLLGALLGIGIGWPLAAAIFSIVKGLGMVPGALLMELGIVPLAAAFAITTVVLMLAASRAARPARRARALDALREAEVPRVRLGAARWIFGIIFALGAIALAVLTALMPPSVVSATSGPAVLAGTISAVLLAPVWLRVGAFFLRPVLRLTARDLAPLASATIRQRRAQFATITACVALVTGIGLGNLASQAVQLEAASRAALAPFRADVVAALPGGANAGLEDRLRAVDGVESVSGLVMSGGWIEEPHDSSHPDRPWPLLGVTSPEPFRYSGGEGSLSELSGDSIALPVRNAKDLGLEIGDTVGFRFGDGARADLTLVGTFDDRAGYESALLPAELLAAHTTSLLVPMVVIAASDGAGVDEVRQAVAAELGDQPLARVGGEDLLGSLLNQGLSVQALINSLMVATAAAYAAIAVVNTLAVTLLSRRREFALLGLGGATKRQLRRLASSEVAVIGLVGVIVGWVVAAAAVLPTAVSVGGTVFAPLPIAILVGLLGVVALIAVPPLVLVMRRMTRGSALAEFTSTV